MNIIYFLFCSSGSKYCAMIFKDGQRFEQHLTKVNKLRLRIQVSYSFCNIFTLSVYIRLYSAAFVFLACCRTNNEKSRNKSNELELTLFLTHFPKPDCDMLRCFYKQIIFNCQHLVILRFCNTLQAFYVSHIFVYLSYYVYFSSVTNQTSHLEFHV